MNNRRPECWDTLIENKINVIISPQIRPDHHKETEIHGLIHQGAACKETTGSQRSHIA